LPAGFNHFGDPDEGFGFVFVPLDGPAGPAIAAYKTGTMEFFGTDRLTANSSAGWLAVNPNTAEIWTSNSTYNSSNPIRRYSVDWFELIFNHQLRITYTGVGPVLRDYFGGTFNLPTMQGGDFNDAGTLLYLSAPFHK
jgi:hypothetical protein